jgi:hypothetical protein
MCIIFASNSFAKDVSCSIILDGKLTDKGMCEFTQIKPDGSFRLNSTYQDVTAYKVVLTRKGVGKIYIEDLDNISHYNGRIIRSNTNTSCWNGVERDIKICVYAK